MDTASEAHSGLSGVGLRGMRLLEEAGNPIDAGRDAAGPSKPARGSHWKALVHAQGGATAVEFALVIPAFVLLLIEILQGGLYVFCAAAVEKATSDAGRSIMIGALPTTASTAQGFRTNVVCANLLAGLSCSNIVTSLQTTTLTGSGTGYSKFVNTDETRLVSLPMDNSQTEYCTGAPGTYGYIQVFYAVPVFSPLWSAAGSAVTWNGSRVVFTRAALAFRNEPFTTASISTGC